MSESLFVRGRVAVEHAGLTFLCRWVNRKVGPTWKCGACGQGVLGNFPSIGRRCAVCGAVVKEAE